MQTYFANTRELWESIQKVGGPLVRDFELAQYGEDQEGVSGYALMYKGITHDIYKVNKTVEMLYNKLVANGLENNVELVYRELDRQEKYNTPKKEAVIELYPGLETIE